MKYSNKNAIKSILTLAVLLISSMVAFAQEVVVAQGTTNDYTTFTNNTIIKVYGTLNFNPSYHNGSSQVIVYPGGIVNIPSSKGSISNIVIDIKAGGTLNLAASFSLNGSAGILNAGTVNASATDFTLNSGASTALENSGTFTMKSFTVNSKPVSPSTSLLNKNTGTINISGAFTVNSNGSYENAGTLKINGAFTNNGTFKNSGTMTTNTATINAAMTLDGALTVAGDITINAAVTGTNGSLTVTDGVSKMNSNGKYTGTNMRFYDANTPGYGFDTNNSATKSTNQYAVSSDPQPAPVTTLPLRFLSFDAIEYNQFSVYFKFTTTVEASLSNIQLQGSIDGKNYVAIENFAPHNISGIFNYTSAKVESAKYTSYRIAVIDLDGSKEYSKTVFYRSSVKAAAGETSIFPNPVTASVFNVKIASAESVIVNIFTNDGRMLSSNTLKGAQQYQVVMPSSAARNSLVTIQIIQNGTAKAFTVLNK